jgi:putative sterol carrier protein
MPPPEAKPIVTPAVFFEEIVPKLLAAQVGRKNTGVFVVKLGGAGGGAWTLDVGAATVVPSAAAKVRADFTLEMPASDFMAMMRGALDVRAAIRERRLKIAGDPKHLATLAALLGAR